MKRIERLAKLARHRAGQVEPVGPFFVSLEEGGWYLQEPGGGRSGPYETVDAAAEMADDMAKEKPGCGPILIDDI